MSATHPKPVNIYDAKTQLSRLIAEVESGAEITISRNGRPVARLVPYATTRSPRTPGVWRGEVTIADDFEAFTPELDRHWYGA